MFTKKSHKNTNSNNDNNNSQNSSIKSWLTGKLGSFLIFSAVGFALYKFGIIAKISKFFKKDKGKGRAVETEGNQASTSQAG